MSTPDLAAWLSVVPDGCAACLGALACWPQALVDTVYSWLPGPAKTLARACLEADGASRPHISTLLLTSYSYRYLQSSSVQDVLCVADCEHRRLV